MKHIFEILFLVMLVSGCANSYTTASTRVPSNVDKLGSGPYYFHGRDIQNVAEPPDIYVKKKNVSISPVESKNETGSLFKVNDQRNYLVSSPDPTTVGRIVMVDVVSNRMPLGKKKGQVPQKQETPKPDAGPAGGDSGGAGEKDKTKKAETAQESDKGDKADKADKEDIDSTLIKAFPKLEPADAEPRLIKRFKMKIAKKLENGDVELVFDRRSLRNQSGHELIISAKAPYEKLLAGATLTTEDLTEIRWTETGEGDLVESESPLWEDEYSLRLSGFSEEKSKHALVLEEQRKQLLDIQKTLENRLKSFGNERREMTKQREDLLTEKKKNQDKIAELEKTIGDQKSELESAKPEEKEKPGKPEKDSKQNASK